MSPDEMFKPIPAWEESTFAERVDRCASMLYVHGLIPLSQRKRINDKLVNLCREAKATAAAARADRKPCTCSDETVARVNAGDICGMGGCPYGGDL